MADLCQKSTPNMLGLTIQKQHFVPKTTTFNTKQPIFVPKPRAH